MALPSSTPRLLLAGCTGLLLLGGIAGAATVGGPDDGDRPTEALASNDTVPPAPSAGAPPDAPSPDPVAPEATGGTISPTTAPTAAPTTTAAGAGRTTSTAAARSGTPPAPGRLTPPKPGSYDYDATTTMASGGSRTDRTTTSVESAGTDGGATVQAITIPLDLGGQQAVARNTVTWSGAGAVVSRSVITAPALGGQQLDCVWQPAFAQYVGTLAVGSTWSFDTRCAGKIQGFDVTLEQRATRRVTGTATVAGPAGNLATWTIADDTTVVITSPIGATSVRMVGTQQLAPSLGLPVRSQATVEATTSGSAPDRATVTTRLVAAP